MVNQWIRLAQGALIGLGAVLPGISGGVLCVIFGIYQPIMELLGDPLHAAQKHFRLLLPVAIGIDLGFLGVSRLLGFLLQRYPDPSVCFFVGLIVGMLPSLYREAGEKGRTAGSYAAMAIAFIAVLGLLLGMQAISLDIAPGYGGYLFCGICLAISVIVPGMSFSTLLMPLGLYTPFVDGIGRLDLGVLVPGGLGAVLTVVLLARRVNRWMEKHYSVMFHGILGVVMAATLVIIPFTGLMGPGLFCLLAGAATALLLDQKSTNVKRP